ncbi:MAG: M15 family metallopeptidase [Candidatus Eremiobacteraeota bacterium]|nr:M15 family metallopeptidase [Candidatus Eremiobacteraeota bacterium]
MACAFVLLAGCSSAQSADTAASPTASAHTRSIARPALPKGFVYLADVAPAIVQDIRYARPFNFVGRPIAGYGSPECILTQAAARALAKVQQEFEDADLTLRVYDCYRPARASADFLAWSTTPDQRMKGQFYPNVAKSRLFAEDYIESKSAHSRGSTVDLTFERLPVRPSDEFVPGQPLKSCVGRWVDRFHDGSIDMGTNFDCLDPLSHYDSYAGNVAEAHRKLLHDTMKRNGFLPVPKAWWHFTFAGEPFPSTYFDFPIAAR